MVVQVIELLQTDEASVIEPWAQNDCTQYFSRLSRSQNMTKKGTAAGKAIQNNEST